MGLLDWRIKRLEKKKKKLTQEQKIWDARIKKAIYKDDKRGQHECAWILAYIDEEIHDIRKKLIRLKRKKACKAAEQ